MNRESSGSRAEPLTVDFERMIHMTPSLHCVVGADGYFKFLNPAWSRILGYSVDELLACPVLEFVHPQDRRRTRRELERLAAGVQTLAFENRYRHRHRSYRWLHWTAFRGTDGLIYGTAQNVTARKRSELRRLQAQNAAAEVMGGSASLQVTLEKLLASIGEFHAWDLAEIWSVDSSQQALILGWDSVENQIADMSLYPQTLRLLLKLGQLPGPMPEYEAGTSTVCFPKGHGLPGLVWDTGRIKWVPDIRAGKHFPWSGELIAQGIRSAAGIPIETASGCQGVLILLNRRARRPGRSTGLQALCRQIGLVIEWERAEIQDRIRERAVEAVSEGILITDARHPNHPIVYANPAFEKLTGYSRLDVLGRNPRFLQGEETDRAVAAQIRQAIDAQRPFTAEILNYKADETPFWNQMTISPVRNPAGDVTHFVGIQRDLTEYRRMQEGVACSQRMEAVGRLAGGVAHDFNNLLTVIWGFAEELSIELADNPLGEMAQEIVQAVQRAAQLTEQLLAFSRRQVLDPVVLDVNEFVSEASGLLRRLIGEDVELRTRLAPELAPVCVDPSQLTQVVMNLGVNARDAMPAGGVLQIETAEVLLDQEFVRLHKDVVCGRYVQLTVSDTGCGMTDEVKRRVFEPFFTTKADGRGTGMGLPTVYGIVKQSRGHIDIVSAPGRGTTFKVYLPVADGPLTDTDGDAMSAAQLSLRGTETVLLVEDDAGVRGTASRFLLRNGYRVLEADSPDEARRLADSIQDTIHLLLTDIVMPGTNGSELARQLLAARPETSILYMSGYSENVLVTAGVPDLDLDFLPKPFTEEQLLSKLRQVLDQSKRPLRSV